MEETHVTREILEAVANGELPARVITQIGMEHLMSLCPVCRREITAFRGEGSMTSHYLLALDTVLAHHTPTLRAEDRKAHADLQRLLALPPERRIPTLQRAHTHFRGGAFVRLLLRKS